MRRYGFKASQLSLRRRVSRKNGHVVGAYIAISEVPAIDVFRMDGGISTMTDVRYLFGDVYRSWHGCCWCIDDNQFMHCRRCAPIGWWFVYYA